jgi:uncharacterized membrane protein (DUF485 family)
MPNDSCLHACHGAAVAAPAPPDAKTLAQVAEDPAYQQFVRERSRFAWTLTAIMLAIFFGYILLIAFAPELLAQRIAGRATTLGIPVGVGVILAGIALTGVYVRRANRRYDAVIAEIVQKAGR